MINIAVKNQNYILSLPYGKDRLSNIKCGEPIGVS
jgi:hypothetical protein